MIMCTYEDRGWSLDQARTAQRYPAGVKVICITNRHLAEQDYFDQIIRIAASRPEAVIVREKDLTEAEYRCLASRVIKICRTYQVPCILHHHVKAAIRLGVPAIHLPLPVLLSMPAEEKTHFHAIGASVHSAEEAIAAQNAGADYLTASHIYATDCKKGLAPKGIPFLQKVCAAAAVPVYALGGIHAGNAAACIQAGAAGVCIMSECMKVFPCKES